MGNKATDLPERGKAVRKKFQGAGRVLRAQFDAARAVGRHSVEKGIRTEQVMIDFLRAHLPSKYGVARGEIVDSNGMTARQCDVVIYDAPHAPLLHLSDSSTVFPAESVYAVIEMKTALSRTTLEQSVEVVRSVKALSRSATMFHHDGHRKYHGSAENPPIFGAVFAFGAGAAQDWLAPEMYKLDDGMPRHTRTDAVCVLDTQLVYHFAPVVTPEGKDEWWPCSGGDSKHVGVYRSGEDTLLMFYLLLLHELNARALFPPDLLQYIDAADLPTPWLYNPKGTRGGTPW